MQIPLSHIFPVKYSIQAHFIIIFKSLKGMRGHSIILLWLMPDDFTPQADEPCPLMS